MSLKFKICLLFQHPRFGISFNETPMSFDLLEDAERQTMNSETEMSTPASASSLLIHIWIVSRPTGL